MKLYGVSGTNGSGKDSFGDILSKKYGFKFISVTELLRDEARHRGLPVEREHLRAISSEWRTERGLGVLVDKAVEMYESEGGDTKYSGLVMASLRNPGEVDRVHELGGKMVWVDADPKIRYQRIYSRQRTTEDDKTFEQFLQEEADEMNYSGDATTLNNSLVKQNSDIVLKNEGVVLEDFERVIEEEIKNL